MTELTKIEFEEWTPGTHPEHPKYNRDDVIYFSIHDVRVGIAHCPVSKIRLDNDRDVIITMLERDFRREVERMQRENGNSFDFEFVHVKRTKDDQWLHRDMATSKDGPLLNCKIEGMEYKEEQ